MVWRSDSRSFNIWNFFDIMHTYSRPRYSIRVMRVLNGINTITLYLAPIPCRAVSSSSVKLTLSESLILFFKSRLNF